MADVHAGSWFGLPDFGVTEAIGGLLGGQRTAQGGSNILGASTKAAAPVATPANPGSYSYNGLTPVVSYVNGGQNYPAVGTPGNPSKTGGTTQTTAPTPQQPQSDPYADLINSIYNSNINDLNNQEATLRGNQTSILGDINSQADTSKGTLTTNLGQSQGQIDQSAQQGEQRHQDALTAARRLYNELMQGGQQRFGGASSAGEAYGALTGRELQRNQQQIESQHNDFMSQIATAHQNVQAKYDDAVAQLENQRNLALNQAQRDFQDKLSQINSLKNQAAGNKASQQLAALQELRNQIYNINLTNSQNSQAVAQMKTQAEAQLANYAQQSGLNVQAATSGLNSFSQNTTTNPQTGLTFGTQGNNTTYTPTGQKNDKLVGTIAGQPLNMQDLFSNPGLTFNN